VQLESAWYRRQAGRGEMNLFDFADYSDFNARRGPGDADLEIEYSI